MTVEQRENIRRYLEAKESRVRKSIDGEKIQCEQCGSRSELEWHHKEYWSEGGDDSTENLHVLCQSCHTTLHSEKDDFRTAGRWGGLVSAYLREQRLGRKQFCKDMKALAKRRWAA